MPTQAERIGTNEARFRELNERIRGIVSGHRPPVGAEELVAFVCECPHESCHEEVQLRLHEYERCARRGGVSSSRPGTSSTPSARSS